MKGHNIFYNDIEGKDRDKDRVGHALSGVGDDGRVLVDTGSGEPQRFEFISDLAGYDAEHDGNRGDCCWSVYH